MLIYYGVCIESLGTEAFHCFTVLRVRLSEITLIVELCIIVQPKGETFNMVEKFKIRRQRLSDPTAKRFSSIPD